MNMKRVSAMLIGMTMSASMVLAGDGAPSDPKVATLSPPPLEFSPMTRYERLENYASRLVGPEYVLRSAVSGAITQATNSPKEWGGGAEAYGWRVGNVFAQHVIRETLQYGISATLHEDNRYFASRRTGFIPRLKYAVASTLLARHDDGTRSLSFSRIGGTVGAAFISREWQPRSTNSAGDGAVTFGVTMGSEIGFNVFREFWPDVKQRFHRK